MANLRRSTRVMQQLSHSRISDQGNNRTLPASTTGRRSVRRRANVSSHVVEQNPLSPGTNDDKEPAMSDDQLAKKKWKSWSAHATSSPFTEFCRPTRQECEEAFRILHEMHNNVVEEEFSDQYTPDTIPHVLDAMIVAILSQATSWNNAKRAMASLTSTYGSMFAYEEIFNGGTEKLQKALRCGGLHIRKSKIIGSIVEQVKRRHGKWDLDYMFDLRNEEAMKELITYKYMGPKSAFVVMGWCLKRNTFTVDTHVYRIAGLWGWRPKEASREMTQAHLDARIPVDLKFKLHFLLIAHGRVCPACRGGSTKNRACGVRDALQQIAISDTYIEQ